MPNSPSETAKNQPDSDMSKKGVSALKNLPSAIGVFDSGLGGITLLKPLAEAFPNENFIYLGDTARLPYGSKSPSTIRHYAEQILDYMIGVSNLKAIVVACNSASTQVNETEWKGVPVFNVIDPGVEQALSASSTARIGLMATRATVASDEYPRRLKTKNPDVQVFSVACPLLVPLAEEGWIDDPITNLVVFRYAQPLLQNQIDTLILGCTHYPILEVAIRKAFGNSVRLVHSGLAMVEALRPALANSGATGPGTIHLLMTDLNSTVQSQAARLLEPFKVDSIHWIDL